MALIRTDKFICDRGLCTRSEAAGIIASGRVCVDGVVVRDRSFKLDPEKSVLTLDGNELAYKRFSYYMMNKPEGVITASEDKKQPTVLDLLPPELKRMGLFPVGRLDKDTSGLLLLTNDGEFAHKVISPKYNINKRYHAITDGVPDSSDAQIMQKGLMLRDGTQCLPAVLEISGRNECHITVTEGKYHQVKRMLAACGKPVIKLKRLSIGRLLLDEALTPGEVRELDKNDLCNVFLAE